MSTTWTHSICFTCWENKNPMRRPVQVMDEDQVHTCCFCGKRHVSNIYIRQDPKTLSCSHPDPASIEATRLAVWGDERRRAPADEGGGVR